MIPLPGERFVRFVGDTVSVRLVTEGGRGPADGFRARLRTTIGRGRELREEIRRAHFHQVPPAGAAWRDLEMNWFDGEWTITLPLAQTGFFSAKAYLLDQRGWQHWPDGSDLGISVQPDWCRTANAIYCAFPRMFGPNKEKLRAGDEPRESEWRELERKGYTIIPPSGKLRDLQRELPHIFDRLGCRILHLLPVSPTPTTMAKFGRFGSPYALQDLSRHARNIDDQRGCPAHRCRRTQAIRIRDVFFQLFMQRYHLLRA
jgi:hypothetical protein